MTIPLQARTVRINWIITRIHMYDSLGAVILPSIAFGMDTWNGFLVPLLLTHGQGASAQRGRIEASG
jgi:hypothetical protein